MLLISEDYDVPLTDNLPKDIQDEINTFKQTIALHQEHNDLLVAKISDENWIHVDETTGKQSLTPLGALALAYHYELILEPAGVF
ncbi:MAG: hypothetical protein KDK65_02660 [Chlamydiia bacterium]|nr:hypothetical protein [Chlamydiia bacterium]